MKKIIFLSLLSLIMMASSCGEKANSANAESTASEAKQETAAPAATPENNAAATDANAAATTASNLAYLLKLKGQYPFDAKVLETDPLKSRLKAALKGDFKLLTERLQTSDPIEVQGDIFFTAGCMPHACSVEECAIAVDVKNDNVFVAILQDGKISERPEKANTTAPEVFKKWVAEKGSN
jgi:hypothetical protein